MTRPLLAAPPRPPSRVESVTPMINVVFLLLVFFLMSATLVAPGPVPARPPRASGGEAAPGAGSALHLSASGELARGDLRGEAALAAAAAEAASSGAPLRLRADREAPAAALAQAMARLGRLGAGQVALVVEDRAE